MNGPRSIKIGQYRIHNPELSTSMQPKNTPKILAFDTSSVCGSIALLEGRELHGEIRLRHRQNHSEHLIRSIQFLLDALEWKLEDLNLIASGIGPGSFTGIRIGISTGLGLAQSLAIPFAGISCLEALGFQAVSNKGVIGVILDAHRDQIYYAEYANSDRGMRVERRPALMEMSELPAIIGKRRIYLTGDTGLYRSNDRLQPARFHPEILQADPYLAAAVGRRALSARQRWKSGDYIQCEPLYIRPPDALKKKTRRI